jgi:hypothetical protein
LTGAPALREARHINTMAGNSDCFTPKLPPESRGDLKRRRAPGTLSARAITACSE